MEWGGLGGALDGYIGVGAKLASKVSSPSCFPVKLRSHGRFEDKFWRAMEEGTGLIEHVYMFYLF